MDMQEAIEKLKNEILNELKNFKTDPSNFKNYTDAMKDIDTFLKGLDNENNK